MKYFMLPILLVLAACGGAERGALTPIERACEEVADAAPAVKQAFVETASARSPLETRRDYQAIRSAEVMRCLRERGLAPRGGVQAVKP